MRRFSLRRIRKKDTRMPPPILEQKIYKSSRQLMCAMANKKQKDEKEFEY